MSVQTNQIVLIPNIPAYPLYASDSGKILITPQTVGAVAVVISLPAPAINIHYRFINGSVGALDGTVTITATAAILFGNILFGPTDGIAFQGISGSTSINFLTAKSVKGDVIDMYSDGINWYVQGLTRVAGAITLA